ncbi:hypothetical protein O3M35_006855 [Rhynocoris fuscipes]|uniref:Uncharacterized protein n=1 Tax=Rhynocoris fuscipes TaxID=488301 RepID=A0AAW1DGM7_9HEMI
MSIYSRLCHVYGMNSLNRDLAMENEEATRIRVPTKRGKEVVSATALGLCFGLTPIIGAASLLTAIRGTFNDRWLYTGTVINVAILLWTVTVMIVMRRLNTLKVIVYLPLVVLFVINTYLLLVTCSYGGLGLSNDSPPCVLA